MLKISKLQYLKIALVYMLLALATVCCFNIKKLLAPARKRAFQCSDDSLSKPFIDDTVSTQQLFLLGIYFPMTTIAICELIYVLQKTELTSSWLLKFILKTIIILTLFLSGLCIERLYKNVVKIKMARLRPHFITVCEPINLQGATCADSGFRATMQQYNCSSNSFPKWAVTTAFTSFPSGHTSLISYSMVFLICYLHLVFLKLNPTKSATTMVWLFIFQICCFFMILFVAISRVLDFKHHWSDVCVGFIGGSSIALVLNYYLKCQLQHIEKWLEEIILLDDASKTTDIEIAQPGVKCENVYV